MTMEERMERGYLWTDTDEYLEEQAKAKDLMFEFNMTKPSETKTRNELVNKIFGKLGHSVWIQQPITIARGKTVNIGSYTYINSGLTLTDDYKITIGSKCMFGTNVTICTTGHPVHPKLREQGGMYSFPVVVSDGVWIGSSVVILPGVIIGENAVIGAGSVVTKDVPANVVAVGNPCKVLRPVTERDREYYYHDMRVDEQED